MTGVDPWLANTRQMPYLMWYLSDPGDLNLSLKLHGPQSTNTSTKLGVALSTLSLTYLLPKWKTKGKFKEYIVFIVVHHAHILRIIKAPILFEIWLTQVRFAWACYGFHFQRFCTNTDTISSKLFKGVVTISVGSIWRYLQMWGSELER